MNNQSLDKWTQVAKLLKKIEFEEECKYDCLMEVLEEELGKNKAQSFHRKAKEKFAAIQSRSEAYTSSQNSQKRDFKPL